MKPAVREQFSAFSVAFEGRVNTMYLDVLGLVTVGVGCLIDTPDGAARLPFVHANGTVASPSEIAAAWHNVKSHQNLAKLHWRYAVPYNNGLSLPDAAVDDLMLERLDRNDAIFAKTFDGWQDFPAEVQLAIHSMGWAMGAGFPAKWGNLSTSVRARDWAACAANCKIREAGNPGVVPRNRANKALFEAAAREPAPTKTSDPVQGITTEDRERIERMQRLWFDEQIHAPGEPDQA